MSGNVYPAEPRIRWDYLQINELLLWATHSGMSDLCLRSGLPAWMRLNGAWRQVTQRPITTSRKRAACAVAIAATPRRWRTGIPRA